MIHAQQLAIALAWGGILILLGVVPGLFQALTEGVTNYLHLFRDRSSPPSAPRQTIAQPRWLGVAGAALITASIAAYGTG